MTILEWFVSCNTVLTMSFLMRYKIHFIWKRKANKLDRQREEERLLHANNLAQGSQTGASSFSQQSSISLRELCKGLLIAITLEMDADILPIRGSCGDQQSFFTLQFTSSDNGGQKAFKLREVPV